MTQPVRATDRLSASEAADVLAIAGAAAEADGTYPLSEDAVLHVRHGASAGRVHLLAEGGYAYLDGEDPEGPSGELVVHPRHRLRGVGTALLGAATEAAQGGGMRFWAHGDDPGARVFAEKNGFVRTRVLWQMRRSLAEPLPVAPLPAGVTLRHFRPGVDDTAWLVVNARAFADHPEQGRITRADLDERMAEPWFDPAGFLIAERDGRMIGFHWTKEHPGGLGEVYVLGVDPAAGGRGVGRALLLAGLRHLRTEGDTEVELYVEADHAGPVGL
ncbi:MAG: mycothiol synthase, partial [Catenulispora sp.]